MKDSNARGALTLAVISGLGFLDAGYLTVKHYTGAPATCSLLEDCEKVLSSSYATMGNVPVAVLGMLYYFAVLLIAVICLRTKNDRLLRVAAGFTTVGFIASSWFVYLQLFVIHAICLYCMMSAINSTVLFVLGFLVVKSYNQNKPWKIQN